MPKGGHRPGAGRKPKLQNALKEAIASVVFAQLGGERKFWAALAERAEKTDLRLLFDIGRYWSDQLHGKAVQRTELSGKDSGPVRVEITTNISLPNE